MGNNSATSNANTAKQFLFCGDLTFDLISHSVTRNGISTSLPEAYFNVLIVLLENNSRVVPKSELARIANTSEDTLYKVIETLRKALGDTEEPRRLLLNERGLGYRFIGAVVTQQEDPQEDLAQTAETSVPSRARFSRWQKSFVILATLILAVAAGLLVYHHLFLKPVASLNIDSTGPFLIARDDSGKELWRHFLPDGNLDSPPSSLLNRSWIGHLPEKGDQEVLFAYTPGPQTDLGKNTLRSSSLLCFTSRGTIKWRFKVGGSVGDNGGLIANTYMANWVRVVFSPGPNPMSRIIVASGHPTDQAYQIAVLDSDGHLIGEYWHPGAIDKVATVAGPNGWPRLLAAGVNNGEKRATLVELDPFAIIGRSTPRRVSVEKFRLLNMPDSSEIHVILFPRTCMAELDGGTPYTRVTSLETYDGGVLVIETENYRNDARDDARQIYYDFDNSLHLKRVFISSGFRKEHLLLEQNGTFKHPWQQDESALPARLEYRR